MATMERAGDMAPPNGIPRPQWAVRFFDENGREITTHTATTEAGAERHAWRILGRMTADGRTVCSADLCELAPDGAYRATGEQYEY